MKKPTKTEVVFLASGIILYLAFLLYYINGTYPLVGHDNGYFFPFLFDTLIHYQENGITIQWFTPSFGGGLPAFPNPQQIQFSLTQLLMFVTGPWASIQITIAFYTTVGYFFAYRFIKDILKLSWQAAVIGGLFSVSGGFLIQHMSVGQISFVMLPLASLIFYFLFSQQTPTWFNGIVIGLVIALTIHSAGFYLIIIFGLSFLMLVPLVYLLSPQSLNFKSFLTAGVIAGVAAGLLSASKLYASFSYLQHFPRNLYVDNEYFASIYTSYFSAIRGFVLQFTGIPFFTVPVRLMIEDNAAVDNLMAHLINGKHIWETDTSISPVLTLLLLHHLVKAPKKIKAAASTAKQKPLIVRDKLIASICLFLAVWLAFEFTTTYGVLYHTLQKLPLIQSLLWNSRYAVSFLFPLSVLGAFLVEKDLQNAAAEKRNMVFYTLFGAVLLVLSIYFLLPYETQVRTFDLRPAAETYAAIKDQEEMYVTKIEPINNNLVFLEHASSQIPYEPIFGYWHEQFTPQVVPGPIDMVDGQYYNMTNPNSLVYDTDELFARFTLDEKEKMAQFARYQQPDWDIPQIQHTLNAISLVSLALAVGLAGGYLIWYRNKKRTKR